MRARLLFALALILSVSVLPSQAAVTNDGPYVNGLKFGGTSTCMAIGDTGLNAGPLAQAWNNATPGRLAITASSNCVTAGFPATRRFTIDAYSGSTSRCLILTDRTGNAFDPAGDATAVDGKWIYNNNPMIWINRNCWTSIYDQRHMTSAGIGEILGLDTLNSAGLNSRVMNMTYWSRQNVQYADGASGDVLGRMYG